MNQTYAQVAYNTFYEVSNYQTDDGRPMKEWKDLSVANKQKWEKVAHMLREVFEIHMFDQPEDKEDL